MIYSYTAGSDCLQSSQQVAVYADWRDDSEYCHDVPERDISYKLIRNEAKIDKSIDYFKQAYHVQQWMHDYAYSSNAGQCLI